MKQILEASGRSLWQVLALYAGASWVVLQVVDVVKDNMGLPDWVFPFAVVLLVIGLPIVLATAIVQAALYAPGALTVGFPAWTGTKFRSGSRTSC